MLDMVSYLIGRNAGGGGPAPTGKIDITTTAETDVSAYATAQVVDADLVAENIKKDVNILGVVGTLAGGEELVSIDGVKVDREMSLVSGHTYKGLQDIPYDFENGSAVKYNNEIYVMGTNDSSQYRVYAYKWDGASWTSLPHLPYAFYYGSAVVYNEEIHILGGSASSTSHYKWDGTSWVSVSTLPYDFNIGSTVVYNNEIHILGTVQSGHKTSHYKWDGSSWTSTSTLPYDFYAGIVVVYNNEIHILSGYGEKTRHYKWSGSTWTSVSTLPESFYYGRGVVWQNEIHLFNGKTHYKWDGSIWKKEPNLIISSSGSSMMVDNALYVAGGTIPNSAEGTRDFYAILTAYTEQ